MAGASEPEADPDLRQLAREVGDEDVVQSWSLTSLQQRLFKTGGRLIRHARPVGLPARVCALLNSGGTLVQTFDTIAGLTYDVSFDLAANFYAGAATKSVLVTAPGFSQTYTFDATGRTALKMGWLTETFQFVAAGSTSSLSFDSQTNSAFGAALDNVRVSGDAGPGPTPVPEPATFVLVGLGLIGFAGWRRTKNAARRMMSS